VGEGGCWGQRGDLGFSLGLSLGLPQSHLGGTEQANLKKG
jgi:hypothetical protein